MTDRLDDAYDQSQFLGFLATKSGERLLVDALTWLQPSWEHANHWFWEEAAEHSSFATLLGRAWHNHFSEIKKRPDSLKAFKTLSLKLAAHQVPIALEVLALIGTT